RRGDAASPGVDQCLGQGRNSRLPPARRRLGLRPTGGYYGRERLQGRRHTHRHRREGQRRLDPLLPPPPTPGPQPPPSGPPPRSRGTSSTSTRTSAPSARCCKPTSASTPTPACS